MSKPPEVDYSLLIMVAMATMLEGVGAATRATLAVFSPPFSQLSLFWKSVVFVISHHKVVKTRIYIVDFRSIQR
jgi:hypothetical protein